jgi:hypothetical protein
MESFDIIISINIHEKPNFLIKQLENIQKYVKSSYIIILNCNDYMYCELQQNNIIKNYNVILNPNYFNKNTFDGTLCKGIYTNILYALQNYTFKYFIILSSREIFYNELFTYNLDNMSKVTDYYNINNININKTENNWHWAKFGKTLLFKYYLQNNKLVAHSAHEGLCFDYNTCNNIKLFLELHNDIEKNK